MDHLDSVIAELNSERSKRVVPKSFRDLQLSYAGATSIATGKPLQSKVAPTKEDIVFYGKMICMGESIIAYGLGSKLGLLSKVENHLCEIKMNLAVCRLHPALTARQCLQHIAESLRTCSSGYSLDVSKVSSIQDILSLLDRQRGRRQRSFRIALLMPSLERCPQLMDIIGSAAQHPLVGLFATVDHFRTPLAWTATFIEQLDADYLHLPTLDPYSSADYGFKEEKVRDDKSSKGRCTHIAEDAYKSLAPKKREAFERLTKLAYKCKDEVILSQQYPLYEKCQLITAIKIREEECRKELQRGMIANNRKESSIIFGELSDQSLISWTAGGDINILVCEDCIDCLIGLDNIISDDDSSSSGTRD